MISLINKCLSVLILLNVGDQVLTQLPIPPELFDQCVINVLNQDLGKTCYQNYFNFETIKEDIKDIKVQCCVVWVGITCTRYLKSVSIYQIWKKSYVSRTQVN